MEFKNKFQVYLAALSVISIAISALCMMHGRSEDGVLICFWVSLLISIYGITKT